MKLSVILKAMAASGATVDALKAEIDGLFAKHRLARGNRHFKQVGMGIGGRGDQDGVNLVRRENRLGGRKDLCVGLRRNPRRGGGVNI